MQPIESSGEAQSCVRQAGTQRLQSTAPPPAAARTNYPPPSPATTNHYAPMLTSSGTWRLPMRSKWISAAPGGEGG